MNDDEIWDLARKPVTEFVESIKQMDLDVDKLVKFYLKYRKQDSSETTVSKTIKGTQSSPTKETTRLKEERKTLSPLASAKLELAIVFAINTCYWMYLVSHGEDPSKKEISKDLDRIRLFMNRAQEVESSLPESRSSSKRPKIDREASKRLCLNNISLASKW